MAKFKLFTPGEFETLRPLLTKRLREALEQELADCALPELGGDPTTDLWDLPPVDSKTVAKLSPVVKELLGRRMHPTWIRKGGYASVEEAITDLLAQIREHCVIGAVSEISPQPPALAVTH
jgi:hypothetical protein